MPISTKISALRGRRREQEALDRLLRDVRAGQSRVLVLRGEAGVGKTALLDYLTEATSTGQVTRAAGVEAETEIAYSALQQLCAPLLGCLDRLPEPQRDALATGFGLSTGDPPDPLLVGLAVLGLFAEAASERPPGLRGGRRAVDGPDVGGDPHLRRPPSGRGSRSPSSS